MNVAAVNDRPTFTIGGNQTLTEDAVAQTITPWAGAFNPGNSFEAGQTLLSYSVTVDKPDLFSAQPAVSPAGVLTFTPAINRNGIATVSITVRDNGGTASGGLDTSLVQTFTITITPSLDSIIFAKPTPTGLADGSSWANAFTLSQAMEYSSSGEEIWVAQGSHTPGLTRNDSFNLKGGVKVLGGFVGGELLASQRNPKSAPTTLSGDLGADGITSNNSFRVVVPSGSGTIDGFIIRDGNANGSGPTSEAGGMYIDGVSPVVSNCIFVFNSCTFTGGAVSIRNSATPIFQSVVFSGNSAQYGGAVYSIAGGTFENCIFQGNSATAEGGAVRTSSGGTTVFTNCTVTGNTAPTAAIHIFGLTNCINTLIWANSPASIVSSGTGTLLNCLVQGGAVAGFTNSGGLITTDPQFTNSADPDGTDNIWGTADDGLFPQATSPARDAGTASGAPAVDIRGSSRPRGNGFDIGGYERGVIYVNGSAAGANNGATWTNAFSDLRTALLGATASDEVWVKAGTYSPSGSNAGLTFPVAAGVGLFGGFNGTETVRDARDWTVNRVTLDGAGLTRNIMIASGSGGVIDGFIVTGANANIGSAPGNAGGGLNLSSSSPTVRNCVFANNAAIYAGGAIYCVGNSSPRIENCLFTNNSAQFGGAIETESGTTAPVIVNCTFTGNFLTGTGGKGTVLETFSTTVNGVVTNCIMWGNGPGNAIDANSSFVATVTKSIIQGSGGSSSWLGGPWGIDGGGNLDADPQFFNPGSSAGTDGLFFTTDDGLLLLTGSPAANSGTGSGAPAQDIRRQSRPTGAGFDMGCYEGQIGRVTFVSSGSSVSESTAATNLAVNLTAAADFPLTVSYTVSGGDAINGIAVTPAGSVNSTVLPIYANFNNTRTTSLYLKNDMGALPTTLRSLSVDLASQFTGTINTMTVRMRHTPLTDFSVASWGINSDWDTVFSGPVANTPTGHLVMNFNQGDSAFIYDGSSNVMVDFIIRATTTGTFASVQGINTSPAQRTLYGLVSDPSPFQTPALWAGTGDANSPTPSQYILIPNLRFSTALGGGLADYTLRSGTLTFAPGQTSLSIPVTILPDLIDENNEIVIVSLSSPIGGVIGANPTHTLTIADDDAPPTVQFQVASSSGSESVSNPTVTVTLSAQSSKVVTVNFADVIGGGNARPSLPQKDYDLNPGTLSFPPGITSLIIPAGNFSILSAPIFDEDNETLQLVLSAPVNATLGSNTLHTYTITDSDSSAVQLSATTATVTESDLTPATVSISLATRPYIPSPVGDAVVRVDVTATTVEGDPVVSNDGTTFGTTASLFFSSAPIGTGTGTSPANAADWNAASPPKIFIRSSNDFIDDADQTSILTVKLVDEPSVTNDDPRYLLLPSQVITVTTHDDLDTAGIVFTPLQSPLSAGLPPLPIAENYFPKLDLFSIGGSVSAPIFADASRIHAGMRAFSFATGERRFVTAVNGGTGVVTLDAPMSVFTVGNEFAFGFENVFVVTLATKPTAAVTMDVNVSDSSRLQAFFVGSSVLDAANWNTGIQVQVNTFNNAVVEADQLVTVTPKVGSTSDIQYQSVTIVGTDVIIYEDDERRADITPTALSVAEGGVSQQYSVVLSSEPSGTDDVVVTAVPNPVDAAQIQVSTANGSGVNAKLFFNKTNWFTAQFVTVSAVDDVDFDPGATCSISNVISGPNNDYALAGTTAAAVLVTTVDNESLAPIVSPSSGLVTSESPTSASFTVRLSAAPAVSEVVSIGLITVNNTGGTPSPEVEATVTTGGSLFFARTAAGSGDGYSSGSPRAWNNPVTVIVTGGPNSGPDGDQAYEVVLPAMTSTLGGSPFIGVDPADVTGCINTDSANAGVIVTGGAMNLGEGTTKIYTLKLTWNPSNPPVGNFIMVSLTPASSDVSVDQSVVLFTGPFGTDPSVYNATLSNVKTITVTATDDQVVEALKTTVIAHAVLVSDVPVFPISLPVQSAQATVTDNDTPGVDLFAPATLATTEAGGIATFSVRLKTQPTAAVTIALSLTGDTDETRFFTAPATESPSGTLTFDSTNWNIPQLVSVIGKDDSVDDGDRTYTVITGSTVSSDGFYSGISILDIPGINSDNDSVGVAISKTTVAVTEGVTPPTVTDSYIIALNSQPTGAVAVALDGGGQVFFKVGATQVTSVFFAVAATGDGSGRDASNPRAWNSVPGVTVTVVAIDDQIKEANPHTATITHEVGGADYSGVPANSIAVTITDSTTVIPGFTVTPAISAIAEAGGAGTVALSLTSKPTSTVVIAVTSSDTTAATVTPASITFTPTNYLNPQTITVIGVNDDIDQHVSAPALDNLRKPTLSFSVASFDLNYDQRVLASLTASIVDDDTALINVAFASGGCVVNEAGTTSTFTVVLATKPVGTVTLPLQNNDTQRVLLSASSLVFTSQNWDTVQTVTVTGQDLDGVNDFPTVNTTVGTPAPTSTVADAYSLLLDANTFDVPVHIVAANAPPRIGAVTNLTIAESAGPTPVIITGIDAGQTGESQTLTFTAVASDPALFPSVTANLVGSTGAITLTPAAFQSGTSVITVSVTDDATIGSDPAQTTTVSFTVTVTAVNDRPVVAVSGATPTHVEGGAATPVLSALTVTDIDNTTLTSATVSVVNPLDGATEILLSTTSGTSIVSSYDPGTSVLSLNASVPQPLADFQQVLRTVSYRTDSDNPTTGTPRTIRVLVSDGATNSLAQTASVAIQATNDSPVLSGTATNLLPINENDISNTGLDVDTLIGGAVVIADPDNTQRGIAIASNGGTVAGTWQFSMNSGSTWTNFPALVGGDHLVLRAGGATNRIRFIPTGDQNGSVSVTWRAWDATDGTADGLTVVVTGAGTTPSPFSASTLTAALVVTPVNDAPHLVAPLASTLIAVAEDSSNHLGDDVASLISAQITDVDTGALTGIAVTDAVVTDGVWQYSVDGGTNWSAFGSLGVANATVLAANANQTRIRFLPTTDFNGTATITYRGWDRSDGITSGQTGVDATGGPISAFSPETATATVTVSPVNDAPVLSSAGPVAVAVTAEETPSAWIKISDILGLLTTSDIDTGAASTGIAVVGVDSSGTWEYSTDSGTTPVLLAGITDSTAQLLSNVATNRIRFTPNTNFNGTASLTLRLWDTINGADGATANASVNGGTSSFSTSTVVVQVTVTPVNDRPVLSGNTQLLGIAEDVSSALNSGALVSSLLATLTVTDPDAGALSGLAVVTRDNTNGVWEYSLDGTTWLPVGATAAGAARVLKSNATNRLRFNPALNFNGTSSCTVAAWDQSDLSVLIIDGSLLGNTALDAYSVATATVSVVVNPVNDAPVLTAPGNPLLAVAEDTLLPPGTTVASLIIGKVSDVADAGAAAGIAVTGTTGSGTWRFSVNSGASWTPIGAVSPTAALLLSDAGTTLVHFEPGANVNGVAAGSITYQAWDRTSGINGASGVDISGVNNGGITAFSVASATSTIDVTPVNDAPTVAMTLITGGTGSEETLIPLTFTAALADVDAGASAVRLTVTAQTGTVTGFASAANPTVTGNGTGTVVANGTLAEIQGWLTAAGTIGIGYQAGLDQVGSRTLTFTLSDLGATGAGGTLTASATLTATVTAVNDAPVLSGTANPFPTVLEDVLSAANPGLTVDALIGGTVSISDVDNLQRGIVVVGSTPIADASHGRWQSTINNGVTWTDLPALAANQGFVLDTNASGLHRLRYQPTLNESGAGAATLTFRAWDGSDGAPIASVVSVLIAGNPFSLAALTSTLSITPVNDAPTLTAAGTLTAVLEDSVVHNGNDLPSLLGGNVTDSDVGDPQGIAVTASDNTNGVWQYSTNNGSSWIAFGTILANEATVLGANGPNVRIRFLPNADFNGTSTITYRAWDQSDSAVSPRFSVNVATVGGITAFSSAAVTATVSVSPVNDAPVLGSAGPVTVLTIAEDAVSGEVPVSTIVAALTTADVDSGALSGIAVVGIDTSSGTWDFSTNGGVNWSTLSGTNDASAELLTNNGTVNRVRFVPNANFAGTAGLTLRLWDRTDSPSRANGSLGNVSVNGGTTPYSLATVVVQVVVTPLNDPPLVDLNGAAAGSNGTATYTEGDGAKQIATLAVVSDIDTANLTGMSIALTAVDAGLESLAVDVTGTSITVGGTATSLTLSGADTQAAYQQVLRTLTFTNSSNNPTVAPRVITVVANDGGAGGASVAVQLTVTVVPVNDAPVLTTQPFTVALGATVQLLTVNDPNPPVLVGSDVETPNPTQLTFIVDLAPGQGQLLKGATVLGIGDTFTLADFQTVGRITYKHTAAVGGTDGFAIRLTDPGLASSPLKTVIVTITGLVPPVITLNGGPLIINEEALATIVDNSLGTGVDDADTAIFNAGSLTVSFGINAAVGDRLSFNGLTSDVGTVSGGTGVAPLVINFNSSNAATHSRITTLLTNLQYQNVSDTPPTAPRLLTMVLNDGTTDSLPVTTTITVTPFNDLPRITVPSGPLVTAAGISRTGQVIAIDPEGVVLSYAASPVPTQGTLVLDSATGAFTYSARSDAAPTDSFTVTVSDGVTSSSQVYNIIISHVGQVQPIITSPAPMVVYEDADLFYNPVVSSASSSLLFELQGSLPGAAFNAATGAISWPKAQHQPAPVSGYYHATILVIDQANGQAFYQPLLLVWQAGGPG